MSVQFDELKTYEDHEQAMVNLSQAGEETIWERGDVMVHAVPETVEGRPPKEGRVTIAALARAGGWNRGHGNNVWLTAHYFPRKTAVRTAVSEAGVPFSWANLARQRIPGGPPQAVEELCDARERGLSWPEFRAEIEAKYPREVDSPPIPKGKFRVLYADPPWQFDNSGLDQSAASHYDTMPTDDICNLVVPAAERSVLFLWATNAMLPDAMRVVEAWGFEYKTNLVWVKDRGPSIGWFVTSRHELLLLAVRGEKMHPAIKPSSVIAGDVTIHSKKPASVYETIESMYRGPYLEIFARNERPGWESWGNEI